MSIFSQIFTNLINNYLWLFILLTILVVNPKFEWNNSSRLATAESLVENKTFQIDDSYFKNTGDKVLIGGNFYSDKPPLPAIFAAIVYFPLYHIFGIEFSKYPELCNYIITLIVIKLLWLFAVIAFYKSLGYTKIHNCTRNILVISLSLGTSMLTWSTTFNNHIIAAAFLSIGFLAYLKYKDKEEYKYLVYMSLALSTAGVCDIPTSIFFIIFSACLIRKEKIKNILVYYLTPAIIVTLPSLFIHYSIHQSILPLQLIPEYFVYEGSPWIGDKLQRLSGVQINNFEFILSYTFHSLFGYRGFLIFNPVMIISLIGMANIIKQKNLYALECKAIMFSSIILILYYLVFTNDYGSNSYSIRWFVPILPLIMFFGYGSEKYIIDPDSKSIRPYYLALFIFSFFIALVGCINPWSYMHDYDSPVYANIYTLYEYITRKVL